jgi:hypothetical protein
MAHGVLVIGSLFGGTMCVLMTLMRLMAGKFLLSDAVVLALACAIGGVFFGTAMSHVGESNYRRAKACGETK